VTSRPLPTVLDEIQAGWPIRTPTRLTRVRRGLGIFGALVYFWQQADAFWEYLLAVVQGLFWPAFMVYEVFIYEVFKGLGRRG
jgi:hypothetical protein